MTTQIFNSEIYEGLAGFDNEKLCVAENMFDFIEYTGALFLARSELVSLPKLVPVNIKELICEENHLTELPESIGNCKELTEVCCCNNKITRLPDSLGNCLKLKSVNCSHNSLVELPETLGRCPNLFVICHDNPDIEYPPADLVENMKIAEIVPWLRQHPLTWTKFANKH